MNSDIRDLKQYYDNLFWLWKLFFPPSLRKELEKLSASTSPADNKASLAIYKNFLNIGRIWHWFFPGLRRFSESALTKTFAVLNSAKLLDNNELISLEPTPGLNSADISLKLDVDAVLKHERAYELYKALSGLSRNDFLNGESAQIYVNMITHHKSPQSMSNMITSCIPRMRPPNCDGVSQLPNFISIAKHWDVLFEDSDDTNQVLVEGHSLGIRITNQLWCQIPRTGVTQEIFDSFIAICEQPSRSVADRHTELMRKLIDTYPAVRSWAITADSTYYTDSYLNAIVDKELQARAANPQGAVSDEEAEFYYYIARNLIRRNTPEATESATTLLLIPAVRALVNGAPDKLIKAATQAGNKEAVPIILGNPQVFAHAEMHTPEYGSFINKIINDTLRSIGTDGIPAALENNKAQIYFYMVRSLIRRNTTETIADIELLLSISAVEALAATEVMRGQFNELIRLAVSIGNSQAAAILLEIEAVRTLAAQNNYYRDEAKGIFDLRAIAQNRESSMKELAVDERKRLEAALKHYSPKIEELGGVEATFNELCQQLQERYKTNPATILINSSEQSIIRLPLKWEEFQKLKLTAADQQKALEAYYQNKDHTAYRFLSKPNNWLASDASFVEAGRCADFEYHKELMALLWLAASDPEIISGEITPEDRLSFFINELALIGRAHNWDRSRTIAGQTRATEQYDDLKGDNPSCTSGMKRRLFQAVIGHPLLNMLTADIIEQELIEFIGEHFKELITTDENRNSLAEALQKVCLELDLEHLVILKQLDISKEKQEQFIKKLGDKYGEQFKGSLKFKSAVNERFKLEEGEAHAAKFALQVVELKALLSETSTVSSGNEGEPCTLLEEISNDISGTPSQDNVRD